MIESAIIFVLSVLFALLIVVLAFFLMHFVLILLSVDFDRVLLPVEFLWRVNKFAIGAPAGLPPLRLLLIRRPLVLRLVRVVLQTELVDCFDLALLLSHKHRLFSPLIVDLAEELKATLMHCFNLYYRQFEVDTQNHHLVSLNAHYNREYYKATHYHKHAKENESWHQQPVVQFLPSFEGYIMEFLHLLDRVRS